MRQRQSNLFLPGNYKPVQTVFSGLNVNEPVLQNQKTALAKWVQSLRITGVPPAAPADEHG